MLHEDSCNLSAHTVAAWDRQAGPGSYRVRLDGWLCGSSSGSYLPVHSDAGRERDFFEDRLLLRDRRRWWRLKDQRIRGAKMLFHQSRHAIALIVALRNQ